MGSKEARFLKVAVGRCGFDPRPLHLIFLERISVDARSICENVYFVIPFRGITFTQLCYCLLPKGCNYSRIFVIT